MVITTEKSDQVLVNLPENQHYYNSDIVQSKFQLPIRGSKSKKNPFLFFYDLSLLSYFCLRDKRFRQICIAFFSLLRKAKKKDLGLPDYIKNAFIDLNSTFIKIGQFLSSRSDLFPEEYVEALAELQDSLPPISFEEVKLLIENELRKPIDRVFKSIDSTPIASASIGQVHKAELLNGSEVVVKVQKPDLSKLFYEDLAILRCLAVFLERYFDLAKDREWVQIVDEIGKTLFEEIDFIQEGKNADRFRKNLRYEERIYIPKVFWQYTTRKLITIEYVPGIKITDIDALRRSNHNPKEIANTLVNAYFKQFFEDGFYHADPHPGNIVVKENGTIVFYDFGMVGRINKNIREELVNVLASIVANNTDALIDSMKGLDLIKQETDITPLKRVIEQAAYKYYDGAQLDSLNLNDLSEDLKILFKDKPMKLPSKFTYTLRMTGTLEGVCRKLDPEFSLIEVAKPYLHNWITEKLPASSKWNYISSLFPAQSKLIEKIKIYYEVVKGLPQYVSKYESKNTNDSRSEVLQEKNIELSDIKIQNESLREEVREFDSKLRYAYGIIFLSCFVFLGMFLISTGENLNGILGLTLLVFSLIGSIGLVIWSLFNKQVVEL